jgi:LysR family transcriptional regulator, glycine cleavage system transcriptional activator
VISRSKLNSTVHVSMNLLHAAPMRNLPPFDGLVAFEATSRHRSMTRAASELGLTQSAVSHRLKRLETFMGSPLLDRRHGGLDLTPAGVALCDSLVKLLNDMEGLRAQSRASMRPKVLRIGAGQALSQYWLIRRLPRFAMSFPDIAIEIVDVNSGAQARAADVDLQILWLPGASARASSTQRPIFQESVFPVAAPELLPHGRPLEDVTALARLPILHKGPPGRNDGAEWSWPIWFERLGLSDRVPQGLRFDTIGMAIAAALDGAGVALARSLLAHDALEDGRLVRVLPRSCDVASSKIHVVRWPAVLAGDQRVLAFAHWIGDEVRALTHAP